MTKILFLFLTTALGILKILSPSNLVELYDDGIVPSVTGILNYIPTITQGTVVFLPKTDPCNSSYWKLASNSTVFVVEDLEPCDDSVYVYKAWKIGGIGVIFALNASNSELNNYHISTCSSCDIFSVGISSMYIDTWKNIDEGEIQVSFERDWIYSGYPNITIALTGDYFKEQWFIEEWYWYLIPVLTNQAYIELIFNYSYNCYNCSSVNCYSDHKYCMTNSQGQGNGRSMIDRTLFEISVLKYVTSKNLYFGNFAIFLYAMENYCKDDYLQYCLNNTLNRLKIDKDEVYGIVNSSWYYSYNGSLENSFLEEQFDLWNTRNIEVFPFVSIETFMITRNQGYGLPAYMCSYKNFNSYICNDSCSEDCSFNDFYNYDDDCDSSCKAESCSYGLTGCNYFYSSCYDIHNTICDYSEDEDLSEALQIVIFILPFVGLCLCCFLWCFCCVKIGKKLGAYQNRHLNPRQNVEDILISPSRDPIQISVENLEDQNPQSNPIQNVQVNAHQPIQNSQANLQSASRRNPRPNPRQNAHANQSRFNRRLNLQRAPLAPIQDPQGIQRL